MPDLPDSVLLCTDYLPPGGGGVEVVVENLAKGLADNSIEVTILTLESEKEPSISEHEEIRVEVVQSIDLTKTVGLQASVAPAAFRQFKRLIEDVEPELIHLHQRFFFLSATGGFWKVLGQINKPLVTTLHLGSVWDIGGLGGAAAVAYEHTISRAILNVSDHVIAVSRAVANHGSTIGANQDNTTVVANAVDPELFYPTKKENSEQIRILFVGRLVRNKGPLTLVNALPKVVRSNSSVAVDIVGTGPMKNTLQSHIEASGLTEAVTFHGHVDSVARMMRNVDIFCRPSTSEGMPLTLLEAMATGLPPVVTPVAGVPEVVTDRETGILVPPNNQDALSNALIELVERPDLRRGLGRKARQYVVNNHTWDQRTEKVMTVYSQVLHRDEQEL